MVAVDMSAARQGPPKPPPTRRPPKVPQGQDQSSRDRREQGLVGLAQLGQGICLMTGLYADAGAVGRHAPPVAHELANCAEGREWLSKPIDLLIEVGPFGALVAAALPLTLQIMANHGKIDPSRMVGQGIVPPEVLEAQMRADVARMQAEALREQREAVIQAQQAQQEYESLLASQQTSANGGGARRDDARLSE